MKYTTMIRVAASGKVDKFKLPSIVSEYDLADKFHHSDFMRLANGKWQVYLRPKHEFFDVPSHLLDGVVNPGESTVYKALEYHSYGRI